MANVSTVLFPILFSNDTNVVVNGRAIGAFMVIMNNMELEKNRILIIS